MRSGRPPYSDLLTPAEWRVVEMVRHGQTNAQIAEAQGVSLNAIKFHVSNALQKLGFSSRSEIRSWDGIAQSSNLYAEDTAMPHQRSLRAIAQVSRKASNIEEARRWYTDCLGLTHLYSFADLAFFDCGGVRLFLSQGDPSPDESILYFDVPNIHAAKDDLAARGITFDNAPHMIHRHDDGTEEWMAFFQDPDGRPLALSSKVKARDEGENDA